MIVALITGLATGALYAAAALTYNVMFSTSKVLSVTTGHISMLGGIFGAWFISTLGWPIPLALLGSMRTWSNPSCRTCWKRSSAHEFSSGEQHLAPISRIPKYS